MVNLYQRSWPDYLAGNWAVAPEFKRMVVRNLPDNDTRMSIDKWRAVGGRVAFQFHPSDSQVEGQYRFDSNPVATATILPFSLNLKIAKGNAVSAMLASSLYANFDAPLSQYGDTLYAQGEGEMFLILAGMATAVSAGKARLKHVTTTIVFVDDNRFAINVYYLHCTPPDEPAKFDRIRLWHTRDGAGQTSPAQAARDVKKDEFPAFPGTPAGGDENQDAMLQEALAEFEVGLERIEFLMLGISCSIQAKGPLSAKLAELHDVYRNIGDHIK